MSEQEFDGRPEPAMSAPESANAKTVRPGWGADVHAIINPEMVEWEMDWSQTKPDGSRVHPDKPLKEMMFEEAPALALLLLNEVVFLNDHWWEDAWPEQARRTASLNVNCNDVFAWGCADAEEMSYEEIEPLYRLWAKDPSWGPTIWCLIKRKEMPQRPVEKSIRAGGIWDLDALQAEHGLKPNHYDGVSGVFAGRKYAAYKEWAARTLKTILPFDASWWAGWNLYREANPDWESEEWKAADGAAVSEWKARNGWIIPSMTPPNASQIPGMSTKTTPKDNQ